MPAVARPRDEPGERSEAAGDARSDDGRLPADREHVAGNRRDREQLGREPRDPEQPRKAQDAQSEKRDVLTRHGQQVVEPGRLEVVPELVGEPFVLAQHDPRKHGSSLAVEPDRDRPRDVRAQPIGDAADPSATTDDAPVAAAKDDVDSAPRKPASLVEAVLRTARGRYDGAQGEDGALRRRASERQLEQDALAHRASTELAHLRGHSECEARSSHRAGHGRRERRRTSQLRLQHAAVEGLQTGTTPPPADEGQRDRTRGHACTARGHRGRSPDHDRRDDDCGRPRHVREGEPDAEGDHEQCRPGARDHGETRSRSCSIRAGPIPGIASRSSTEPKPPC